MTLYEILKVGPDASSDQIKRAFRQEVMRWHPDRNPDNLQEAEKRFRAVVNAYEVLSDSTRRAFYDAELKALSDPQLRAGTYQEANRVLRDAMYSVAVELYQQGYDENGMIEVMRGRGCPYSIARDVAASVLDEHSSRSWFSRLRPSDSFSYDTVVLYTTVGLIFMLTVGLVVIYALVSSQTATPVYAALHRPEAPAAAVGAYTPVKGDLPFRHDFVAHTLLATRGVTIVEEGAARYRLSLKSKVSNSAKKMVEADGLETRAKVIFDQIFLAAGQKQRLVVFAGEAPPSHTLCRPCGVPLAAALFRYEQDTPSLVWWNGMFTVVGQFGEYPDSVGLISIAEDEYALRVDDKGMHMRDYFGWADLYTLSSTGPKQIAHLLLVSSYGIPSFDGEQAFTYYDGKPVRSWLMKLQTVRNELSERYDIMLTGGGFQGDTRQLRLVPGPREMLYRFIDGQYRLVSQSY